jgi:hypothetical protein
MTERVRLLKALDTATELYLETKAPHDAAREMVVAAVLSALRDGIEPTTVAERSPFTAAYIRRLARDNNIPPAKQGMKRRPAE